MDIKVSFFVLATLLFPPHAGAAELHVLCSNGFRAVMNDVVPQFERATSNRVEVVYGLSAELIRRIESGETFDVTILTPALIDRLVQRGTVTAPSRTDLARSAIGLAIRRGAPRPDVRTAEALRRTMLDARSIAYAKEGASASFFLGLVERLGLSEALKPRIIASASGAAVAGSVASGDVALGVMPVSEILPVTGIEVGGTFPGKLAGYITMTGGISRRTQQPAIASDLIRHLTADTTRAALPKRGMEPPPR